MTRFMSDLNSFIIDIKNFIIYSYESIKNFLLNYMDETALGIFAIVAVALIVIFIFRQISE